MFTLTIVHRRTREALHTVTIPATRDIRRDKAHLINSWRAESRDYRTPVAVLVSRDERG